MGEAVVKGDSDEVRCRMEKVVLSVPDESCTKGSVCPILASALKELNQLCVQYKGSFAHHICRSTKARTVFNAGIHSTKPSIIHNAACIMAAAIEDADLPWSTSPQHSLADRFTELLNATIYEYKTVRQICLAIGVIAEDVNGEPKQNVTRRKDFRHKMLEAGAIDALIALMLPPRVSKIEEAPYLGRVLGVCAVEAASALFTIVRYSNFRFNYTEWVYKLLGPDMLTVLVEMAGMDDTDAQLVGLSALEAIIGLSQEGALAVNKSGGYKAAERVATLSKGWKFEKNGNTAQTIAVKIVQSLKHAGLRIGQVNAPNKGRLKQLESASHCQCGQPLDLGGQRRSSFPLRPPDWLLLTHLSLRDVNKFTYNELRRFVEVYGSCSHMVSEGKGRSKEELLEEALKVRAKQRDVVPRKSCEDPFLLDAWSSSPQGFLSGSNSRRHFQGEINELGEVRSLQQEGDVLHRGVSMVDMDGRPVSDDEMGDGLSQTLRELIRAMNMDEDTVGEEPEDLDKLHAHDAVGTLVQLPTLSPQSETRIRAVRALCALRSGAKQLLLRSSPVPFLTLMEQATDEERQGLANAGYLKCLCSMVTKGREDYAVTAMRSLSLFCRSGCLVGNTSGVDGVVMIDPVIDLLLDGSDEANLPASDVHYACVNFLADLLTHPVDLFPSVGDARMTRLTASGADHMGDADRVVAIANYLLRRGVPQRVQCILFLTTTGDGPAPRSSQLDGPWPMAHACLRLLRSCLRSRKAGVVLAETDRIFDSLSCWLEHITVCPDATAHACGIYAELHSFPSFMAHITDHHRFLTVLYEFSLRSKTLFESPSVHQSAQGIFVYTAKYLAKAGSRKVDVTPQTVEGLCDVLSVAREALIYDSWLAVELLHNYDFVTVKQLQHLWPAVGDALCHLGKEQRGLSAFSDDQVKGFTVMCRGLVRLLRCPEDREMESDSEKNIRVNLNSAGPLPADDRKYAVEELLKSKITSSLLPFFFNEKLAHLAFDVLRAMVGLPPPSWPPGRTMLKDQQLLNAWFQVLLDGQNRENGATQAWGIALDALRRLFMANPEAPRKVVPSVVQDATVPESSVRYVYERNELLVHPLNAALIESFISSELAVEPTSVLRYRGQRNSVVPQNLHSSMASGESIKSAVRPLSAGSPFQFSQTDSSVIYSLPSSPLPTASALSHSSHIARLPIPHRSTPTPCSAGTLAASPPAEMFRIFPTPTSNCILPAIAIHHCDLEAIHTPSVSLDLYEQEVATSEEADCHSNQPDLAGYSLLPPSPQDQIANQSVRKELLPTLEDASHGLIAYPLANGGPVCEGHCADGVTLDRRCTEVPDRHTVLGNGLVHASAPAGNGNGICSGVLCLDDLIRSGDGSSANQHHGNGLPPVNGAKLLEEIAEGMAVQVVSGTERNGKALIESSSPEVGVDRKGFQVADLKKLQDGDFGASPAGGLPLGSVNLTTNLEGQGGVQEDDRAGSEKREACSGMCGDIQCRGKKLDVHNGMLADAAVKESEWSGIISAGGIDDGGNTDTESFNSALGEDEASVWGDQWDCSPESDCSLEKELEPLVPSPCLQLHVGCNSPVLTPQALSVAPLGDRQNASLSKSKVNGWATEETNCVSMERGVSVEVANDGDGGLVNGDTGDAEKENMVNAYKERMMRKTLEDLGSMLSKTCKGNEEAWTAASEEGGFCNDSLDDAEGTIGVETSNKEHCHGCKGCGRTSMRALKKCSRCRKVDYCSVECQKKDWRNHKAACGWRKTK